MEELGHDFVSRYNMGNESYNYICLKCKLKVYYDKKYERIFYYLYDNMKLWKKVDITCEEWVIKNIIE